MLNNAVHLFNLIRFFAVKNAKSHFEQASVKLTSKKNQKDMELEKSRKNFETICFSSTVSVHWKKIEGFFLSYFFSVSSKARQNKMGKMGETALLNISSAQLLLFRLS